MLYGTYLIARETIPVEKGIPAYQADTSEELVWATGEVNCLTKSFRISLLLRYG